MQLNNFHGPYRYSDIATIEDVSLGACSLNRLYGDWEFATQGKNRAFGAISTGAFIKIYDIRGKHPSAIFTADFVRDSIRIEDLRLPDA